MRLILKRLLLTLILCFTTLPLMAVVETYEFDSEVQRKRYHQFVDELRCPKCQNQNLDGSDAEIARDLRRELHRLLKDGRSDAEIVHFMVERYGDFILYKPRLNRKTLLLWVAPALFLFGGAVIAFGVYRRQRAATMVASPDQLSAEEQARLRQLLDTAPDTNTNSNTGDR